MANPTTQWDYVPVYGVYLRPDDTPIGGQVTFGFPQRVLRVDGRVIYADGARVQAVIGDSATQNSVVREAVRAAWRAADEAAATAAGEPFDGSAWDVRWTDVIVPGAVFVRFPAMDDPDIVHDPTKLGTVEVKESLASATGKTYPIQPLMAQLDLPIPGINLGLVEVPPGSPTNPPPVYAKGVPGGVASLDADGLVPVDQLPGDLGGGVSSWDDLEDKPAVIAAGADATAARAAIGAQPAGAYLTSVPDATATAKGVVELATTAEAAAGTDTDRAVTPAGVKTVADGRVPQSLSGGPGRFRGIYATAPSSLPDAQVGDWIIVTEAPA